MGYNGLGISKMISSFLQTKRRATIFSQANKLQQPPKYIQKGKRSQPQPAASVINLLQQQLHTPPLTSASYLHPSHQPFNFGASAAAASIIHTQSDLNKKGTKNTAHQRTPLCTIVGSAQMYFLRSRKAKQKVKYTIYKNDDNPRTHTNYAERATGGRRKRPYFSLEFGHSMYCYHSLLRHFTLPISDSHAHSQFPINILFGKLCGPFAQVSDIYNMRFLSPQ